MEAHFSQVQVGQDVSGGSLTRRHVLVCQHRAAVSVRLNVSNCWKIYFQMVVQQLQCCDEMWGYSGIFLNGMSGVENIKDDIDLCDQSFFNEEENMLHNTKFFPLGS